MRFGVVTGSALFVAVVVASTMAQDKPATDKDGFQQMFDLPKFWVYDGGGGAWGFYNDETIASRGTCGWLMHPKQFGDVEVRFQYKMGKEANSGIVVRCAKDPPAKGPSAPYLSSYEIQLVDDDNSPDGKNATTCTGSIYGIVPALKRNVSKPLGEWNDIRVQARGTKVVVTLNGEKIQDVDLKDHADKVKNKNPHFLDTKGYFGIQGQAGAVEFRNLRFKELVSD